MKTSCRRMLTRIQCGSTYSTDPYASRWSNGKRHVRHILPHRNTQTEEKTKFPIKNFFYQEFYLFGIIRCLPGDKSGDENEQTADAEARGGESARLTEDGVTNPAGLACERWEAHHITAVTERHGEK